MNTTTLSRLAFLATISNLHAEPLTYDLACLRELVAHLEPDLLCVEITPEMWSGGELSQATVEVRDALAPIAAATNVVIVPVTPSPQRFADFAPHSGWRRSLVQSFEQAIRWGQRTADHPETINGPWFEAFCHTVCALTEMTMTAGERLAWNAQNQTIAENILQAVRRDPGRRVLAAVQCQRIHKLEPLLKSHSDLLELVHYRNL